MHSQSQRLALATVLISGFAAAGANAATIDVIHGSFENPDPTSASGHWANLDLAWDNGPAAGLEYEQNDGDNIPANSGIWSVYLLNSGAFTQSLGGTGTVQVGDTLSVTFEGGKGSGTQFGTAGGGLFTASFQVGDVVYGQTFDTTTNPSTWQTFTLTKTITNIGSVNPGALMLAFAPASGKPWLDTVSNVTQTSAVPEPASLGLIGLAGAGLLARRRRHD